MSAVGSADPTPRDVLAAAGRLSGRLRETALEASPFLAQSAGVPVFLKLECFQPTRSFKVRGAFNALVARAREAPGARVVAASAGNHGLGVALACRQLGLSAVLYVPSSAPETKVRRIRELGAEVRVVDGGYDEAEAVAALEGAGAIRLHAFDDPLVVAGQGTVALEIARRTPEVAEVVVPVGGGGLLAGVGLGLRAGGSEARPRGVQSDATRAMFDAFQAGRPVDTAVVPTLADGLAGAVTEVSFRRARRVAHDLQLVREGSLATAIAALYRHHGVVAEGSGAVGVAALLEGVVRPEGPTVAIVTGGNIDAGRLARILAP